MKFHERVRNILTHTSDERLRVQALETLQRLKDHEPQEDNAQSDDGPFREGDMAVLAAAFVRSLAPPYFMPTPTHNSVVKEFLPQPGGGRIIKAVAGDEIGMTDGVTT